MYWCFRAHNIKPSEFYQMEEGERRILKVFMKREIEEIKHDEG